MKPCCKLSVSGSMGVAPRAGAWIETHPIASMPVVIVGRPPRGGVD